MLSDDISAPPPIAGLHAGAGDRRFQRVNVSILGRYMLADRREFPCQVLSMSPGDAVEDVLQVCDLLLERRDG